MCVCGFNGPGGHVHIRIQDGSYAVWVSGSDDPVIQRGLDLREFDPNATSADLHRANRRMIGIDDEAEVAALLASEGIAVREDDPR